MAAEPSPALRLSIVVPAFNEESRLPATLEAINTFLDGLSFEAEIVVADDGSADGTARVAAEAAEKWPRTRLLQLPHRGKGHAVKQGMLVAKGEYLLLSDADLSVPIEEAHRFLPPDMDADIAIGSREAPGAQRLGEPEYRHLMGRIFNRIVRTITGLPFQDTQCGFKMFRRDLAQALFDRQRTDGFGFDAELLFLAQRRHLRIVEIPVVWRYGEESRVRPVRHSLAMVGEALMIRWNWLRGGYA